MIPDHLKGQKDTSSMEFEQRKYKRLLMKDNVFAAVRGGFRKVGKIDDISIQGLGFSYLKQTDDTHDDDQDYQVDIFLPHSGFHLFNIPCKTVYEKTGMSLVEGFPVKLYKCGLHFGKLSDIQRNLLDLIITKFTVKRGPKEKLPMTSEEIFDMP